MLESPMPEAMTKHSKKLFHDAKEAGSVSSPCSMVECGFVVHSWPSAVHNHLENEKEREREALELHP